MKILVFIAPCRHLVYGWESMGKAIILSSTTLRTDDTWTPKTVTRNRPIAHRSMRFAHRSMRFAHRIHVGTLPVPPAPQNPPFPSPPAPPATTCVLAGLLLAFVPPVGAPGSHGHYHGQGCRWPGFLQHYLTNTPQDTRQQPPRALCSTGKLIRG